MTAPNYVSEPLARRWIWLALLLLLGTYALATLPHLSDYPEIEAAQMIIAAPAYKLAEEGVYGSDMHRGFFRADEHFYVHMPLYALPMAAVFKLFGPSVLNARLLSVFYGALVILLTFALGRRLYDDVVGLTAASLLCLLRLGHVPNASGIPLFDIARLIRYDILAPVWVLAACLAFHWALKRQTRWGFFLTGFLAGLATLTQVYGPFVVVVAVVLLLWHEGSQVLRRPDVYLIGLGWFVAVSPWLLYMAQDLAAYRGQMLNHRERLDFLNPWFYVDNLTHEPWRFLPWLGGSFRQAILWPRLGIWLFVVGMIGANVLLWQRVRDTKRFEDRLLFISLPVLWLLLASLVFLKRYVYVMLLLPFFALQLGVATVWLWRWARHGRFVRPALVCVTILMTLETGVGVAQNLRTARAMTPYLTLTEEIANGIPPDARLLALAHYWLGLRHYDFYTLELIFVLTAERFDYPRTPSVAEVIDGVAPDYIIVSEPLLKAYKRDPESMPRAELAEQWRQLDEYIGSHCPTLTRAVDAVGYERVLVHQCASG